MSRIVVGLLPLLLGAGFPDPLALSDGQAKDGKADLAVIVAVTDYSYVQAVPGAEDNALAWERYLREVRGVPVVKILRGVDVTRENVLEQVGALSSSKSGRAWLVFVGHGSPSYDGTSADGRLLMVDAQRTAKSIMANSVGRAELLGLVEQKRPSVVAVVDACFSGMLPDGSELVEGQPVVPVSERVGTRATVLAAAGAKQVAGELPGAGRPAFSYLVLGGLRGWADADGSNTVTARELQFYSESVLTTVLTNRVQTPTLEAVDEALVLSSPTRPSAAPTLAAAAAPVVRRGEVRSEVVVPVGVAFDPEEALRQQECQNEANGKAAVARDARLEAAARSKALELAASWRALAPKVEACSKLADAAQRKACEPMVTSFLAGAEGAAVSVTAGGEAVSTACGTKDGLAAGARRSVVVTEVEVAKASLARVRAGPNAGPVTGAVVTHTVKGVRFDGIVIGAGTFTMGSPVSEAGRDSDEDQVSVTLTRGFEMMKTEVTQGLYAAVTGKPNPSNFSTCGATCPVEQVSWEDAQAFARALNAAEGLAAGTWRLPTEAEWEYAARGGKSTLYAGSNEVSSVGWTERNSGSKTHAACGKAANGWGLCDMTGNVWEWVGDWNGSTLPGGRDPQGPGAGYTRVGRGGGWGTPAENARVAYRNWYPAVARGSDLGFRLVRSTLDP